MVSMFLSALLPAAISRTLHEELEGIAYLDVAGLLHESASVFRRPVAFGELNPEKLQGALKVSLEQVLLGCLHSGR